MSFRWHPRKDVIYWICFTHADIVQPVSWMKIKFPFDILIWQQVRDCSLPSKGVQQVFDQTIGFIFI